MDRVDRIISEQKFIKWSAAVFIIIKKRRYTLQSPTKDLSSFLSRGFYASYSDFNTM